MGRGLMAVVRPSSYPAHGREQAAGVFVVRDSEDVHGGAGSFSCRGAEGAPGIITAAAKSSNDMHPTAGTSHMRVFRIFGAVSMDYRRLRGWTPRLFWLTRRRSD